MAPPLLSLLKNLTHKKRTSFHTPGHKGGKAFEALGDGGIQEHLYGYDTTEIYETDQLQDPSGVLEESQQWTAEVFGSDHAYYLVNGSSGGILSMLLSQTKPGDEILLPRDVHQSVIHALILGDLTPRFMEPEMDPELKIPRGITVERVSAGLRAYPNCTGVLITHPNYYGRGAELLEIREYTKKYEKLLWVDQAHGAHLDLDSRLPASGVSVGADLTVMSFHKTLPAMTQTAVLFVRGDAVDRERLQAQLNIHQSSSPSYVLMASIEQGTRLYQAVGREKMRELLLGVDEFQEQFQQLRLFHLDREPGKDPTKIWIDTQDSGMSGPEVEKYLREEHQIDMELAMPQGILALSSMGNTEKDLQKLYFAFQELEKSLYTLYNREKMKNSLRNSLKEGFSKEASESITPDSLEISIRSAFYRKKEWVAVEKSLNHIAGRTITPYPPGIPLIYPGERITGRHIDELKAYQQCGIKVHGIKEGKIRILSKE